MRRDLTMPKKSYLRIKDLETGQSYSFKTYREVAEFCSEVTGIYVGVGAVYGAFQRCGLIAKKRFATCASQEGTIPVPDMTKTENNWEFVQFEVSPTVLTAEKKLKWYDEELMQDFKEALRDHECKSYWDTQQENTRERKKTRVEVYKKFRNDVGFNDKIAELKRILKEVGLW